LILSVRDPYVAEAVPIPIVKNPVDSKKDVDNNNTCKKMPFLQKLIFAALIIGVVVGGSALLLTIIFVIIAVLFKRRKTKQEMEHNVGPNDAEFTAINSTSRPHISLKSYNSHDSRGSNSSNNTSALLETGIWNIKYTDLKILLPPLVIFCTIFRTEKK
jgi:hypothetical protein